MGIDWKWREWWPVEVPQNTETETTESISNIINNLPGDNKLFEKISINDGIIYNKDSDYILTNFRDIRWIGREPEVGKKISMKYGYFPTYTIFGDQPMPNTMENKYYPQVVNAKLWTKTLEKDVSRMPEQNFNNPDQGFWQWNFLM
mgnify:CR=1 FL=1